MAYKTEYLSPLRCRGQCRYAVLFLALVHSPAIAYEYEAEGRLEGIRHMVRGSQAIASVTFHVYVRNAQWLVRVLPDQGPIKYVEAAYDGKSLYQCAVLDSEFLQSTSAKARAKSTPAAWSGSVSYDKMPFQGPEPYIPVVWLGLASGQSLTTGTNYLAPPYSTDVVRPAIEAEVWRHADEAGLPERIIFWDKGLDTQSGEPKRRPAPFDTGFTNALFAASEIVQVGQVSLPRRFSLHVFRPEPIPGNISTKAITLQTEYNVTVTQTMDGCRKANLTPDVVGEGLIMDMRFVSRDAVAKRPLQYKSDRWLPAEKAAALPGFSNYVRAEALLKQIAPVSVTRNDGNAIGHIQNTTARRAVFFAFVLGSIVFFVAFWKYTTHR